MRIFNLFIAVCFPVFANAQEICTNGIDDDGNGLIDLQDTVCQCQGTLSSLIPNPSFEQYDCCPSGPSMLSCATSWEQASDATTDYFHSCGYIFPVVQSSSYYPFPDGNGAVGFAILSNYREYLGACLNDPMIPGTPYALKMNAGLFGLSNDISSFVDLEIDSLEISVFGTVDCSDIPFNGAGCPGSGFTKVGSAILYAEEGYQLLSMTFTPGVAYTGIVIGPDCALPNGIPGDLGSSYFVYAIADNLIINESAKFDSVTVTSTGLLCKNNLILSASVDTVGGTFQWYKDSIAIPGKTSQTLSPNSTGSYQVVYRLPGSCISGSILVDATSQPEAVIVTQSPLVGVPPLTVDFENGSVNGDNFSWEFGNGESASTSDLSETYSITYQNYGTFQVLLTASDSVCTDVDTLVISLMPGNLIILSVPNVITPNSDGVNDLFVISTLNAAEISIKILNRWGENVATVEGLKDGWNGKIRGVEANEGVYFYTYLVKGLNGDLLEGQGFFHLVR